jgi:hypothetical protein
MLNIFGHYLNGVLALGKRIPELDGPVPGARHNLQETRI